LELRIFDLERIIHMATITQSTSIDCRAKELFSFFTKPADIISVSPTMPSLHFHSPKLLSGKDQTIHYDLSHGVYKLSWITKTSEFEPYSYFEDTLVDGPFKKWTHKHSFSEKGSKTIIHDEINYEVSHRPLGKIMNILVINYQIENFIKSRLAKTTEKFQQIKRNIA